MKPAFDDGDENEFLLFNYLEGNLSAEEEKALEQELLTDVSLQTELGYWRESFIEPELYDTKNLEDKLLMPETVTGSKTNYLQAIIALLLTGWFSILPVPLAIKNSDKMHPFPVSILLRPVNEQPVQTYITGKTSREQPTGKEIIPVKELQIPVAREQFSLEPLPAIQLQSLAINQTDGLALLAAKEVKVYWKKKPAVRTLSGKERRQIARMKERALQRRRANDFLKGRVPYVVPLNTNNF